jgi:hypothetical protein
MDRARVHEKVRQMRFEGLLERHERGELSQGEAAERCLGWVNGRFGAGAIGFAMKGLRDWRTVGWASRPCGVPRQRRSLRMLELYSGSYADFAVKHFHEQLSKRHDY